MKTIIEFEDEKLEVDTEDIASLREAMLFKAKHIKAKAETCLFEAVADSLITWHPYPLEKPTDIDFYLVTCTKRTPEGKEYKAVDIDLWGNSVSKFSDKSVTAWAELPKPFDARFWV